MNKIIEEYKIQKQEVTIQNLPVCQANALQFINYVNEKMKSKAIRFLDSVEKLICKKGNLRQIELLVEVKENTENSNSKAKTTLLVFLISFMINNRLNNDEVHHVDLAKDCLIANFTRIEYLFSGGALALHPIADSERNEVLLDKLGKVKKYGRLRDDFPIYFKDYFDSIYNITSLPKNVIETNLSQKAFIQITIPFSDFYFIFDERNRNYRKRLGYSKDSLYYETLYVEKPNEKSNRNDGDNDNITNHVDLYLSQVVKVIEHSKNNLFESLKRHSMEKIIYIPKALITIYTKLINTIERFVPEVKFKLNLESNKKKNDKGNKESPGQLQEEEYIECEVFYSKHSRTYDDLNLMMISKFFSDLQNLTNTLLEKSCLDISSLEKQLSFKPFTNTTKQDKPSYKLIKFAEFLVYTFFSFFPFLVTTLVISKEDLFNSFFPPPPKPINRKGEVIPEKKIDSKEVTEDIIQRLSSFNRTIFNGVDKFPYFLNNKDDEELNYLICRPLKEGKEIEVERDRKKYFEFKALAEGIDNIASVVSDSKVNCLGMKISDTSVDKGKGTTSIKYLEKIKELKFVLEENIYFFIRKTIKDLALYTNNNDSKDFKNSKLESESIYESMQDKVSVLKSKYLFFIPGSRKKEFIEELLSLIEEIDNEESSICNSGISQSTKRTSLVFCSNKINIDTLPIQCSLEEENNKATEIKEVQKLEQFYEVMLNIVYIKEQHTELVRKFLWKNIQYFENN